jgi:hypothetical protein
MFVSQMATYQYFPFVVIKSHPFVIHDYDDDDVHFVLDLHTLIGFL